MNKILVIITCLACALGNRTAFAQQPAEKIDLRSAILKIKDSFSVKDLSSESVNVVNEMKSESETTAMGVDKETALKLKNLRNPFEPQLPVPETASEEGEKPKGTEAPPTPEGETPAPVPEVPPLPVPVPGQYIVSGLVWDTDRPQAILNGKIVQIGDKIDNWTIAKIDKTGVALKHEKQNFLLEPKGAQNGQ